jgi:hypothetical protein
MDSLTGSPLADGGGVNLLEAASPLADSNAVLDD